MSSLHILREVDAKIKCPLKACSPLCGHMFTTPTNGEGKNVDSYGERMDLWF